MVGKFVYNGICAKIIDAIQSGVLRALGCKLALWAGSGCNSREAQALSLRTTSGTLGICPPGISLVMGPQDDALLSGDNIGQCQSSIGSFFLSFFFRQALKL